MEIFDVTNLSSDVYFELGKQTISFWIENTQKHYTQDFITDGIELILNKIKKKFKLFPIRQQKLHQNPRDSHGNQYGTNIHNPNHSILYEIIGGNTSTI